ncbi:substrate-binding periplasmic protein [Thalassotalea euphylliae]|uniref:Solute-binding protein family 3/N-terminal domain-containing protein n=1 Tax=Thalassotalea euphylliae TaxID=1655234 RepID=A0A3E0UET9_9GAMM|nr:transporter substrate-binding domain-containing protein [Thalassotalea euphylliae]REL35399.1 hypothetical protein DXX92_08555 [Thalassotalea euphylliae]
MLRFAIWMALVASFYSTTALCATLVIASDDAPPHMIAKTNSGIDLDIVTQVLKSLGHRVSFTYAPLHRTKQMVINGDADVVVPTFYQEDNDKLYFSAPIIKYRPTIFTRLADKLSINKLSDIASSSLLPTKTQIDNLAPNEESSRSEASQQQAQSLHSATNNVSVVSFQGATGYFGEAFAQAVESTDYRELHDMSKFPAMLVTHRADIIILDYYIFYYYLSQAANSDDNIQRAASLNKIQEHYAIPEVNAYAGFRDPQLRDEFNRELASYIANNKREAVIAKYLDFSQE